MKITLPHNHGEGIDNILKELPALDNFKTAAGLFQLLGDASRVRIFWILCHCEECVINLSAIMEMSSPAVSHHLKQLKASGLIISRREGKEVYYKASDTEQAKCLHDMLEGAMSITCPDNCKY